MIENKKMFLYSNKFTMGAAIESFFYSQSSSLRILYQMCVDVGQYSSAVPYNINNTLWQLKVYIHL